MDDDDDDNDITPPRKRGRPRKNPAPRTRYDSESVLADPIDYGGSVAVGTRGLAVLGLLALVGVGVAALFSWHGSTGFSFGAVPFGGQGGKGDGAGDGGEGGEGGEGEGGESEEGGEGGEGESEGEGEDEEGEDEEEGQGEDNAEEDDAEEGDGGGADEGQDGAKDCPVFPFTSDDAAAALAFVKPYVQASTLCLEDFAKNINPAMGLREYYAEVAYYYLAQSTGNALPSDACVIEDKDVRALRDQVREFYDEVNHV